VGSGSQRRNGRTRGKEGSLSTALSVLPEKKREEKSLFGGRSAGSFPEQRLVIKPREKALS